MDLRQSATNPAGQSPGVSTTKRPREAGVCADATVAVSIPPQWCPALSDREAGARGRQPVPLWSLNGARPCRTGRRTRHRRPRAAPDSAAMVPGPVGRGGAGRASRRRARRTRRNGARPCRTGRRGTSVATQGAQNTPQWCPALSDREALAIADRSESSLVKPQWCPALSDREAAPRAAPHRYRDRAAMVPGPVGPGGANRVDDDVLAAQTPQWCPALSDREATSAGERSPCPQRRNGARPCRTGRRPYGLLSEFTLTAPQWCPALSDREACPASSERFGTRCRNGARPCRTGRRSAGR